MADTAAFDTLATARKRKAAGIAEAQAEAIAEAVRADLATKADLSRAVLWQCAFTVAAGAIGLMQALG